MDDSTEGLTPQHGGSDGIEWEDLCATFFDGQFDVRERYNKDKVEHEGTAKFKTTNEALEELFGGPAFAQRDDDHDHLTGKKGDIRTDHDLFSDDITVEELFGPDQESDHTPKDAVWWERENPENDYDYELGRKTFRGTDPEDEPDELVRNDRVHRLAYSSLDPSGKAIYATKSVRRQRSAAYRRMTQKLDGGWAEYKRLTKGKRDVSSEEQYKDKVRYLFAKLRKAGEPVPNTEEGWAIAVREHERVQAEKRLRVAVVKLICDRQGCVDKTGRNRLERMIKHANEKGRWHETLLNAFIKRAARLSDEERAREGEKCKRRPKRVAERKSNPAEERRDRLRGDPMRRRPDYRHVPPRHC